jgi:hypothetical protein
MTRPAESASVVVTTALKRIRFVKPVNGAKASNSATMFGDVMRRTGFLMIKCDFCELLLPHDLKGARVVAKVGSDPPAKAD